MNEPDSLTRIMAAAHKCIAERRKFEHSGGVGYSTKVNGANATYSAKRYALIHKLMCEMQTAIRADVLACAKAAE